MQLSEDRILTSHVGSLPRPDDLVELLAARDRGDDYDAKALANRVASATMEVVRKEVASGIDIVNDGEMGKFVYRHLCQGPAQGIQG